MSTYTLNEARAAHQQLTELQQKASALPALERETQRQASEQRLNDLLQSTRTKYGDKIAQLQQLEAQLETEIQELMEMCAGSHNTLLKIRKLRASALEDRATLVSAHIQHSLKFDKPTNQDQRDFILQNHVVIESDADYKLTLGLPSYDMRNEFYRPRKHLRNKLVEIIGSK